MRVLWVATKCPWPPRDGGRRLVAESLAALAGAGVEVVIVAPEEDGAALTAPHDHVELRRVAARRPNRSTALARSTLSDVPFTLARHRWPALGREVARLAAELRFDAVVAEQLQSLAAARPARDAGVPLLLRAQNVESALWRGAAARARGLEALALAREAKRLAAAEAAALASCDAVLALSEADRGELERLSGGRARVVALAAPFPPELPAAAARLAGDPPLVAFGSSGWRPNEDAERFLEGEVWPAIAARHPGAVLHRFGDRRARGERSIAHPPPEESREAFAPGSILLLPLRVASGVRIRLLEAWARGVPVIATTAAAAGLEVADSREALLAEDGAGFADAVTRLCDEPGLAGALIAAGRARLAAAHDPAAFARRFRTLVESVARR